MRWETVRINARPKEKPDGKKSLGRNGGIWGPGIRWGHTCNAVKGGRYLYVFGGYGKDRCQTNDVHVFDTVKHTWTKPMMKGVPPSRRDSHTCTTVGNMLFIFGGTDGRRLLNDLHILDTSSNTWLQPTVHGKGPNAREGHTAVLTGKQLFIFGGCGEFRDTRKPLYYNDLYILDTEKLIWECAVTHGTPPSARDCHSCSLWKNKIIVIAGEDSSDAYLSDVHILDTETLVWEEMNATGTLPPRAGHTTVTIGSNIILFGGFTDSRNLYDDIHVLNVDSRSWRREIPVNKGPSCRFSVAGDCVDKRKGIIVLIGGCNKNLEALDDMYYLHTEMPVVNGPLEHTREKTSIRAELKKRCREEHLPSESLVKDTSKKGSLVKDNELKIGATSDSSQPTHSQDSSQPGVRASDSKPPEITFEARITNSNSYGHAIETVIDGKLLHGMLFRCTSSSIQGNHDDTTKLATDYGDARQNMYQPLMKTNAVIRPKARRLEKKQAKRTYGGESASQELFMGTLASNSADSTRNAVVQPNMTSINVKLSSLPDVCQRNDGPPDDQKNLSEEGSCEKASDKVEEIVPSPSSQGKSDETTCQKPSGPLEE